MWKAIGRFILKALGEAAAKKLVEGMAEKKPQP